MSLKLPKCVLCKHYYDEKNKMCCKAFPEGIPLYAMIKEEEKECNDNIKYEEEKEWYKTMMKWSFLRQERAWQENGYTISSAEVSAL